MTSYFSWLPSIEEVLQTESMQRLGFPQPLLATAARFAVEVWRQQIGQAGFVMPFANKTDFRQAIYQDAQAKAVETGSFSLRPVLNATGVVLHSNLGRAPLSIAAQQRVQQAAFGYCNLEMSLTNGKRTSRYDHLEPLLLQLTGAESALVVNNNAAAVLLAIDTLARRKEVIISRGELVEIGGSFRLPEVMEISGATLKEIGTTNKTYLQDYVKAITPNTGLLLKVHLSNFNMNGFVADVPLAKLAALGAANSIPLLYDWGSGSLFDLTESGIGQEPSIKKILASGIDIITFSADKLLGGPQAGIIVGKKAYINKMKDNPLNRALRIDKLTIGALEATLKSYFDPQKAATEIPVLAMLLKNPADIQEQADILYKALVDALPNFKIEQRAGKSQVGGGSLPGVELDTTLVQLQTKNGKEDSLAFLLRQNYPGVLGYIHEGWLCFDLRTLAPGEEKLVAAAIIKAAEKLDN